jgi:hypothetical protein
LNVFVRRFPPPWMIDEHNNAYFIVKDATGRALAYLYFEKEPGRRSAAKLLTKDEARRMAAKLRQGTGTGARNRTDDISSSPPSPQAGQG